MRACAAHEQGILVLMVPLSQARAAEKALLERFLLRSATSTLLVGALAAEATVGAAGIGDARRRSRARRPRQARAAGTAQCPG